MQAHQQRVHREDALKHLYENPSPTLQSVAGALHISIERAATVLDDLESHGLMRWHEGGIALTSAGKEYALQVIRAHRLWERYLAERTGYPQDDWHRQADSAEHRLSPSELDALAEQLGHPRYDPHGDPIPTSEGRLQPLEGQALSTLSPDQSAHIVHLEDEPAGIYRHLTASGLHVGQHIRVTGRDAQGIHFQADGRAHTLTHLQAESVSVQPAENMTQPIRRTLAQISLGEKATIAGISSACQGPERRRLLDLGFVPGTEVRVVMQSPGGRDLRAYEVRGTMIALRRNQAEMLLVNA
ncbi:MAG: DNA-binding protein [Anaerolineae bacterium]|nr:MAG: DNA-binding protein [Anaerolineae bacterium]